MSRWFRFYDDAMNDPKVLLLSDALKWAWVTMLCTASQNNGVIPSLQIAALALRASPRKAGEIVGQLAARGLLDIVEGGYFEPHNWKRRQFKSDQDPTAAERQQRYRDRHKDVTERDSNALCNGAEGRDETRTETDTKAEAETDQQSLTPEINILSLEDVKGKAGSKPRHCSISRDKKRVFVWTGTPEWDAYAEDFRQSVQREPIPRADGGMWFKTQGQAAE